MSYIPNKYDDIQNSNLITVTSNLAIKNLDLTSFNPLTAISPLTNTATGVVNQHFGGRRLTCLAGANLVSGRVVTVRSGAVSTILEVVYVNGGIGEEVAQSQMVGVTLSDATTGNPVEIAIDGICSILAGAGGTAVRGGVLVVQSGSTGKLQSPGVNVVSNEVVPGFSLTQGAVALNAPVLVQLRQGFEHF